MRALASGSWVTAARATRICRLLLVGTILCYALLLATAHGTLDYVGRPLGTDFSDVYAAGLMADQGRAAAAWVWPAHYAVQQALHRSNVVPFYGWHYPPPFLLIASLLAALPYLAALAVWQGATLIAAAAVARRIVPGRLTMLAVLAAPATFVCIGHGQNAFLTVSLLGGGLWLLDRRPGLAGLLLGCLVYKPQFALLLPVVLLVAGYRRAMIAAVAAALVLVAATVAIWGWPVWDAFLASLPVTRTIIVEGGQTGWEKIVSAFAMVRAWGAPVPLAYAVQGGVSALAVAGAAVVGRWASPAVRGAGVCAAAVLSTPYVLDYDLVILGGAICFLVADARERGWLTWEKSGLALAYAVPLVGRQVAGLTAIPVDWLACAAVFGLTLRRAWVLDLARSIGREGSARRAERLPGTPSRPGR